ncbi:MAG: LacI family DNA-binding transcriptional regulator [Enterobacterales bacterium endosymbiont of Blomia tropicalis]|uniref:LacI family DNA-binding transcriptional regulator n=1 Tax=Mixta mediterraneensis TaxID=2758443 RepID=UPI0025A6B45C|nr:LacI family DNA-binding transcriptional regulator [Mixta mediterraneensis]MDL4915119.1 LacI family DNA-binding transcriptional regulator [Mixta mediterraneensis]
MKKRVMQSTGSRATLADIVRESGMSRSTVSRALAGKGYVSPDKKQLILDTAEKLGYRVSTLARALRTQRSMTLGVLVADITNPLFPAIVKGIDEVVSAAGYTLFLCNTDENSQRQQTLIRSLLDRHIDGLILVSQTLNEASRNLLKNGPPCVFVNRMPSTVKGDYIGPDNVQAINLLLEHLQSLGHRHIACITGPAQSSTARERKEAYLAGMQRLNFPVQPGYVIEGDYHGSSGKKAVAQLLQCQPQPTAVLAANDFVALNVINGLIEQGMAVPDDISVCGFDDAFGMHFSALARLQEKGLTTIAQPKRELGQAAARALLTRINNPHEAISRTILPVTLQVRDTSGKA